MAFSNTPSFSSRTLEDFKARLIGGAARPNLFEVELNFPSFATEGSTGDTTDQTRSVSELSRFMIKTANLPASNVGVIEVPFRGRTLKIAGDRTFDVWTVTVINDVDFKIRTAFEKDKQQNTTRHRPVEPFTGGHYTEQVKHNPDALLSGIVGMTHG